MNASPELFKAVEGFEAELARSSELPRNDRKEMIRVRRVISMHVAEIAKLIQEISNESAIDARLRSEFSKVRHAMALHQATWPVVSIDFEDPGYRTSLRAMRDINRTFISLCRTALGASNLDPMTARGSKPTALPQASTSNGAPSSVTIEGREE